MLSVRYLMAAVITAGLAVLTEEEEEERKRRMRMRRRRRYWIHPIIANRANRGHFWAMYDKMRGFEDKFFNYIVPARDLVLSRIYCCSHVNLCSFQGSIVVGGSFVHAIELMLSMIYCCSHVN